MQPSTPQPARKALAVAMLLATLPLAGCLSRGPAEMTGSIAGGASQVALSPEAARAASEAQGRRFESDPADAANAVAYARSLRALNQNTQAVAVLQQTAIRNPADLGVMAAYGKSLADAGRLREAADVLSRAHMPERPDWRILSAQGAIADQLGQFEQAQRYYDAALKIVPGEPSVLSNQGLSLALARRLPEAERTLREAAAHPAADARVRQNLALVQGLQGKFADADATLKRDLSGREAASNMVAIRKMVKQPNSWAAIRQSDAGDAAAIPLDVRRPPAKAAAKADPAAKLAEVQ